MVGIVLLALLVAAVVIGLVAGGGDAADRIDTWMARAALALALLGEVGVGVLAASLRPDELPILLAFAAVPLVLTAVPFALPTPTLVSRLLTAVCALLLAVCVGITVLSIGLFFAPAALALVQLAALRARRQADRAVA